MTEKKRYRVDCLNNVMDTNYDFLGHPSPFDQYVIDEDDYFIIGEAKTQNDGEEICKLLNKLAEDNEILKSKVEYIERKLERERYSFQKQHDVWEQEVTEKNKQLIDQLRNDNVNQKRKLNTAMKKNEQLTTLICHLGYTIKNNNGEISLEYKESIE